jgi:hypothetical protein
MPLAPSEAFARSDTPGQLDATLWNRLRLVKGARSLFGIQPTAEDTEIANIALVSAIGG